MFLELKNQDNQVPFKSGRLDLQASSGASKVKPSCCGLLICMQGHLAKQIERDHTELVYAVVVWPVVRLWVGQHAIYWVIPTDENGGLRADVRSMIHTRNGSGPITDPEILHQLQKITLRTLRKIRQRKENTRRRPQKQPGRGLLAPIVWISSRKRPCRTLLSALLVSTKMTPLGYPAAVTSDHVL